MKYFFISFHVLSFCNLCATGGSVEGQNISSSSGLTRGKVEQIVTTKSTLKAKSNTESAARDSQTQQGTQAKSDVVQAGPAQTNITPSLTTALCWVDSIINYFDGEKIKAALGNLPTEPFLLITSNNLPDFLGKALKIVEKIYPEFGAIAFIGATSFLGGVQCPGFDKTSNIHLLFLPYEKSIMGVWFFKARADCPLVKNLAGLKNQNFQLSDPINVDKDKNGWYMYGQAPILSHLQKNLKKVAPFIYDNEKVVSTLANVVFEPKVLEPIVDTCPPLLKFIFKDFIKKDIEKLMVDIDFDGNNIVIDKVIQWNPISPVNAYYKKLQSKLPQARILQWSSLEPIKTFGFDDYSALKMCYEALAMRAIESEWKKDPVADQIYKWGVALSPLFLEAFEFLEQNFTGNFQTYGHFDKDRNFGLFETKNLTSEKLLTALEHFCKETLKKQLSSAIDQKLQWSEFLRLLTCVFDKNIQVHKDYTIHGCLWSLDDAKQKESYSWVFATCKNYLLYANNIEDLKRLIERVDEMKTPTYINLKDSFEKITVDLSAFIKMIFNIDSVQDSVLETTFSVGDKLESLVIRTQFPIFFNVQMFLNLLQNSNSTKPIPATSTTKEIQK